MSLITPPTTLSFSELAQFFHLPITEASEKLGICATVLKKICRRYGVSRWPHRKIKSLERMIEILQSSPASKPEEQKRINEEIQAIKRKLHTMLTVPKIKDSQPYLIKSKKNSKEEKKQTSALLTQKESEKPRVDQLGQLAELIVSMNQNAVVSPPSSPSGRLLDFSQNNIFLSPCNNTQFVENESVKSPLLSGFLDLEKTLEKKAQRDARTVFDEPIRLPEIKDLAQNVNPILPVIEPILPPFRW